VRQPARTVLAGKDCFEKESPVSEIPDSEPNPKPEPKDVAIGGAVAFLLGLLAVAGEEVGRRLFGKKQAEPEKSE